MTKFAQKLQSFLFTSFFACVCICMLANSDTSLALAGTGLHLWFENMIPALFPFMILSGTLIRMGLSDGFVSLLYPLLRPVFRLSKSACYVIVMGFMCGFPMGAKCINDLYANGRLSQREAEWLLSFCNNIGPVYLIGFALPLINCNSVSMCIFGMYGLPLLYGFILRYTIYRDCKSPSKDIPVGLQKNLFQALNESIVAAIQSILSLGGYMILFNMLMLIPAQYAGNLYPYIAPVLEISGGLILLGDNEPLWALLLLPFGGLSCIAQTYACIGDTKLSIGTYVIHKLILVAVTGLYYFLRLRAFRLL